MDVVTLPVPQLGNRCHLVHDRGLGLVVDPPRDHTIVEQAAAEAGVEIVAVADTHVHNDYVSGAPLLARRHGADYLVAADESVSSPHVGVRGGDVLAVGSLRVEVIDSPGHTDHHQAFLVGTGHGRSALLSGGSLLHGTVGRTDLISPERTLGLARAQWASARTLASLPPVDAAAADARVRQLLRRRQHRQRRRRPGDPRSPARHQPGPHDQPRELRGPAGRGLRTGPHLLRPHARAQPGRPRRRGPRGRAARHRRAGHRRDPLGPLGHRRARPGPLRRRPPGRHRQPRALRPVRDVRRMAGAVAGRHRAAGRRPARTSRSPCATSPGSASKASRTHTLAADQALPATYRRARWEDLRALADAAGAARRPTARRVRRGAPARARSTSRCTSSTTGSASVPAGEVWVYCRSGFRAGAAASILQRAGRAVVHLDDEWTRVPRSRSRSPGPWPPDAARRPGRAQYPVAPGARCPLTMGAARGASQPCPGSRGDVT